MVFCPVSSFNSVSDHWTLRGTPLLSLRVYNNVSPPIHVQIRRDLLHSSALEHSNNVYSRCIVVSRLFNSVNQVPFWNCARSLVRLIRVYRLLRPLTLVKVTVDPRRILETSWLWSVIEVCWEIFCAKICYLEINATKPWTSNCPMFRRAITYANNLCIPTCSPLIHLFF